MKPRVLIIDDDSSFSSSLKCVLELENIEVVCAKNPQTALEAYREAKMDFDTVLVDYEYKGHQVTGADLALKIRQLNPHQTIIFMTAHSDRETLDSMLAAGVAKTFFRKQPNNNEYLSVIKKTLSEVVKTKAPPDTPEEELKRSSIINSLGIAGRSREFHDVAKIVLKVRQYQSRFLIIGESGTGKELIAKAFATEGKPFYAINCASYDKNSDHLMESQLFGRKKGSYTGADTDMKGAFEEASGGVLFLDEVHHLSLAAQAKLLRALQENKYRRFGDMTGPERKLDVTIVAAAKPILLKMIKSGEFMEDLYYRLKVAEVKVPALRDRPSDIKPIAEFLVQKISKHHQIKIELYPQVIREFETYSWPGNIRELECFIEESAMCSEKHEVTPEAFRKYVLSKTESVNCDEVEATISLEETVDAIESDKIIQAIIDNKAVAKAAVALGMKRTTLISRMKRLGIDAKKILERYLGKDSTLAFD